MADTTILLADNDEESREFYADVLRTEGYNVIEAESSSEAREKLNLNLSEGDLAVFDLHLEHDKDKTDQSGLELAKEAYRLNVPALILTGDPQDVLQSPDQQRSVPVVNKEGGPRPLVQKVRSLEAEFKSFIDDFVPVVFLAHGHDKDARDEIVEFLEKVRMQVVVLQAGTSETIIERFERCSQDVQLAIILVTPDDVGCKWEVNLDLRKLRRKLKPRARQNVIFELGYLTARLGRLRIIVLSKGGKDIELPSDYAGVVPVEMDADGDWRERLFREVKRVLRRVR